MIERWRRWRRVRAERRAEVAQAAPHAALIRTLVEDHLPELQRRARRRAVRALCDRLVALERSPYPLVEEQRARQLAILISRAQQAIDRLDADIHHRDRRFAHFAAMATQIQTDEDRRELFTQFVRETVTDRRALRGDLRALDRDLDLDALRERHARERHRLLVCAEVAIHFIRGAAHAALSADRDAVSVGELVEDIGTFAFLADRVDVGPRWIDRVAALDALIAIARAAADRGGLPDSARRTADAWLDRARDRADHPWVQVRAIELLFALGDPRAADVVRERLAPDAWADAPPRDFLARAELAVLALRHDIDAVSVDDPSEHVRIEVCRRLPTTARAVDIAVRLAEASEASANVRAAAVDALARVIATAVEPDAVVRATDALCARLAAERDPLPLEVACDRLAEAAAARSDALDREPFAALARRWIEALAHAGVRDDVSAATAEIANAAAEAIERECTPARRALDRALRDLVASVPPGGRRRFRTSALPPAVDAALSEPRTLGRALAAISRDGLGVSASLSAGRLTVWRGDRFRRRLWRILHELRNPAPNKRQGYVHTVGRTPRGELRAPPGRLDEATATTVPGERVQIASDYGWGRHLPAVDDLLGLPLWSSAAVHLFSSHGVTTLTPPARLWARLRARLILTWRYAAYADLRRSALEAINRRERGRFIRQVRDELGIDASFSPYRRGELPSAAHASVAALFPAPARAPDAGPPVRALALVPAPDLVARAREWLDAHIDELLSYTGTGQAALALFVGAAAAVHIGGAYRRRRAIERARAQIPLSIGGWGTRGKSGTERIKAGLFHGLGFEVFSKTTGCEAMFIHSVGGQRAEEIFIYRPYDKATIWEQANMLDLAARLGAEVFLWECMALNPRYVEILQHGWMRDDLATLTNAYPDHEDIQGPAGKDVAETIARFIPRRSTVFTSEVNFLPLFETVASARGTRLIAVPARDASLLGEDLLALFPYREHPHNIALVARMAEELGIERNLAIATMAEHVVPDLGVLKTYPTVTVRGRDITFVQAMSANERTGFLTSWRRIGLDHWSTDDDPRGYIVTVVNNRADRIPRSEVFARIIVRDIAADRHMLIGTNLEGLRGYIAAEVDALLADEPVLTPDDLGASDGDVAFERVARHFDRLRVPRPEPVLIAARLRDCANACGFRVDADAVAAFAASAERWLAPPDDAAKRDGSVDVADVIREIDGDRQLRDALERACRRRQTETPETVEAIAPPTASDVAAAIVRELARMVVRARVTRAVRHAVAAATPDAARHANALFERAYRSLLTDAVVSVDDPNATGDQLIDRAARLAPPGARLALVGCQNIKGTGLDFAHRWVSIDTVVRLVDALASPRADVRQAALAELEAFEDHGVVSAAIARHAVRQGPPAAAAPDEEAAFARLRGRLDEVYEARLRALTATATRSRLARAADWIEGGVDFADAVARRRRADAVLADLVAGRLSHGRAALRMRDLVSRGKGGWLAKSLAGRRSRR